MRVAVIGAGVSGLTCAVVLSEAGHEVRIVAREVEETTSHAAAAIWFPYHIDSEHVDAWALATREELVALTGEETGVSLIDFDVLSGDPPHCIAGECIPIAGGFRARVPLVDTTRYLPYLRRRFGGAIEVGEVRPESLGAIDADLVVNCSGFGARELFGDELLVPGYGISVVTDRPAIERAVVRDEPEMMYVIPRRDDCILGGYDRPVVPPEWEVEAIVARCRAAVPEVGGRVRAVRRGIRPVRPSVRLEAQATSAAGIPLVHNYGHGGAGFTVSWGCAREVERLTARLF